MQEQADLSWDGVIYPIQTLSWEGVVETAKKFDGLMVDEDFHVTYKDEEREVIHVKNETDLNEALLWARERHLHLLLEIPFPSLHDSDDDWSLAGDSPKHRPREPDNSTLLEADQLMNFSLQAEKTIFEVERITEEDELRIKQEEQELRLRKEAEKEAEEVSRLKQEEEELRLKQEEEELRLKQEEEELRLKQEEEELRVRQEEEELRVRQEEEELRVRQEEEEFRVRQEAEASRLRQQEELRSRRDAEEASRLRREEEELRLNEQTRLKEEEEKMRVELSELEKLRAELQEMELRLKREAEELQLRKVETISVKEKHNEIFDEDQETIRLLEALRVDQTQQSYPNVDDFINKVTEIECSEFDEASFRKFVSQYFSDSKNVQTTLAFMQTAAFHSGFLGAVQSLDTTSLFKASQTQVLKHAEDLVKWFQDVPLARDLVLDLLRYLKKRSCKNTVLHRQVMCDGCTSSPENAAASVAAGYRSAAGDILGVRYKSALTQDYDLCEFCESSGKFQGKGPFLKIVDPASAPESILVILPGTNQTLTGQLQSLDWRNPLAAEFKEFVEQKLQKPFSRASTPQASCTVKTEPPTVGPVSVEVSSQGASIHAQRCKHSLKTFTTPHAGFGCDICNTKVPINTVMNGCRICNWDACTSCLASPTPLSTPPPPQAKFVSDVTLADGSVVRPGEVVVKTWRIRNTGQDYWPAHTRIAHVGGDAFGGPLEGVEVPCAAPGEAVNVGVNLKMPQQPGRYTSYWRLMTPSPQNAKFGHRFWVTVNVVPPQPERALPNRLPQLAPQSTPTLIGSPVRPVEVSSNSQIEASNKPVPLKPSAHDLAVAQLVDMGFTNIDQVVQVLKEVDGDVERAIVQLMT